MLPVAPCNAAYKSLDPNVRSVPRGTPPPHWLQSAIEADVARHLLSLLEVLDERVHNGTQNYIDEISGAASCARLLAAASYGNDTAALLANVTHGTLLRLQEAGLRYERLDAECWKIMWQAEAEREDAAEQEHGGNMFVLASQLLLLKPTREANGAGAARLFSCHV
eukprot:SAG11_NODE_138_length_15111_cov_11.388289_6_plen_166_part_00